MQSSEEILEAAARDGSIDIAEWPRVLETLLQRLHDIVHNDFPLPSIPLPESLPPTIDPEVVSSTPPNAFTGDLQVKEEEDLPDADEGEPPQNSQSSTKENDVPTDIAATRTSVPGRRPIPSLQNTRSIDRVDMQSGTLPPDLLSLYTMSRYTLERDFSHSPPYTIQRLAELVIHPKQHYRFLPAYLRALDRIITVSSPVSDFPLPALHTTVHGSFLTNGDTTLPHGISERDGLGSDESLGGALLTPIPWLRNNALTNAVANGTPAAGTDGELHSHSTETIDGPHGAGSIETVTVSVNGVISTSTSNNSGSGSSGVGGGAPASPTLSDQSDATSSSTSSGTGTTPEALLREQGGVTQGELLRQEQEAGVIPLNQTPPRRMLFAGGAVAVGREDPRFLRASPLESVEDQAGPDELPHARGPEEIGPEDMGPQHHSFDGGLDLEAAVGRGRSKSPQPASRPVQVLLPEAEAEAELAKEDRAGEPGMDPADVEKEVEKLRDAMDVEKEEEVKDADGDAVVADADGRTMHEKEKMEITGDLGGADAVDTTAL